MRVKEIATTKARMTRKFPITSTIEKSAIAAVINGVTGVKSKTGASMT